MATTGSIFAHIASPDDTLEQAPKIYSSLTPELMAALTIEAYQRALGELLASDQFTATQARARGPPGGLTVLTGYLRPDELAAELRVSTRTLARWRIRRDGPPIVRIGRRLYYRRSAVDTWLAAREREACDRTSRAGRP